MRDKRKSAKLTYAASGVDVKAGEEAVERIKKLAAATFNEQVLTGLGSFGGFFKPELTGLKEPVFVSSTDSVGTKLKLAFMTGRHDTIGQDLVNHCVNDILVHGARGLFFLDYVGVGKLRPEIIVEVIEGLTTACRETGVALIGGEMAELPDFYQPGEYDLVGFVVGVVDKKKIIDGSAITEGDVCIGLPSTGLHTNGYTLARKAAFEIAGLKPDARVDELNMTIAEALMKVHRCYAPVVHSLLERFDIHGMAHITGGGIPGNLKRVLPGDLAAEIDRASWTVPPLFEYLRKAGDLDPDDIYSAFNMGIGYILVVGAKDADGIMAALKEMDEDARIIGSVRKGKRTVTLVN
ncbi:MAG: phosphoribosylformylglycinamidine cyclo-ligase [Candidatus Zixiibacteriota bacterium]|nr:MAG: phosphoribosylformylglycinamidine cyclo-ligase [candidate division Zixibacteria bacterium]